MGNNTSCIVKKCNVQKYGNSNYCKYHKCIIKKCKHRKRAFLTCEHAYIGHYYSDHKYCRKHKCIVNNCKQKKIRDSDACYVHTMDYLLIIENSDSYSGWSTSSSSSNYN